MSAGANSAASAGDDCCVPAPVSAIDRASAEELSATLKVLADPLRLRILSVIAADPRGETCVCDLTALSDVSQPTVSHHLKRMKEAGLLVSERRGTWVYYRVSPASQDTVAALLGVIDTLAASSSHA